MADVVFGFLLDNLSRIITQEVDLIAGVKDEVKLLQLELKMAHAHLKSFEGKSNEQDVVKEYANQVRDLVYEAEDIIDLYVAKSLQRRRGNVFEKAGSFVGQWGSKREVANQINVIRTRFNQVYNNRDNFGVQFGQASVEVAYAASGDEFSLYEGMDDIVGLDKDAEMIIDQLKGGFDQREIIPIVGMSGIGKSTLAKKVFNDPNVVNHFDFQAWVSLPQVRSQREFLEKMMKIMEEFTDVGSLTDPQLHFRVHNDLKDKRYLIILDDVWENKSWEEIIRHLPKNNLRSRIILTTQLLDVARFVSPTVQIHQVELLSLDDSWDLLSTKIFGKAKCPANLGKLGMKIAGSCGGLPLAIVVIAGVLRMREKTEHEWTTVSSSVQIIVNEERQTNQSSKLFELSYNNLPQHLRPCFLYFANVPQDYEVPSRLLINLWIAEEFIPQDRTRKMEEVAEAYLQELISRNLVHHVKRRFDGAIKSCGIHDLLRAFCITKAAEMKFLETQSTTTSTHASRRLGIHTEISRYIASHPSSLHLRSLRCFRQGGERISSKHWKLLYSGYILLKVLDLWGVDVDKIPEEIQNLICLKYLRIKSDTAETLPQSISNLWNLQTLDVITPRINRPNLNVWKMRRLRHFYFNGEAVLPKPPKKMVKDKDDDLNSLQTLSGISPDSCTETILSEVPNVVTLRLYGDLENHKNIAFKNLSVLRCLRNLKLVRAYCYPSLTALPSWAKFPPTLIKLTLSRTQLSVDPMKQLASQAPTLQVLKLVDSAYDGKELDCTKCTFPHLKFFKLVNLGIKSWSLSTESMPSLERVVINRCGSLSGLAPCLKEIDALAEMHLYWPNVSVAESARDIESHKGKGQFKLVLHQAEARDGTD